MFRKSVSHGKVVKEVVVLLDGESITADEGEPVAAILLRHQPFISRHTPISGTPRAPFCMMGACFDCLVEIDGETSIRSCVARARGGMAITRQICRPNPHESVR
jgi:predicted molibdopterin-dependent oxidoreductase YjgC